MHARFTASAFLFAGLAACVGQVGLTPEDAPAPREGSAPANMAKGGEPPRATVTGAPGEGNVASTTLPSNEACAKAERLAPSPLRRLSHLEYDNTVRDLLGVMDRAPAELVPDEAVGGFLANSLAPITQLAVEKYETAARAAAAAVVTQQLAPLVGCTPTEKDERACAAEFVGRFAPRAFRRPLDGEESAALLKIYDEKRARGGSFAASIQLVVETLLVSPSFLYRPGFGTPAVDRPGLLKLDDHSVASRLSYLIWSSMPDSALLEAARRGELGTAEGIAGQARRMLADRRFADTLRSFHTQWLRLTGAADLQKDAARFPDFTEAVRSALARETELFVEEVVLRGDARLATLLSAPFSFVNAPLARLYRVSAPPGAAFARVELPSGQRAGVLTQLGFLAGRASQDQSSPVLRGVFVREHVLCQELAPPPPNVNTAPPALTGDLTTRQRFEQHRRDPACAGCHDFIDPLGFAFEQYDAVGRFRTEEGGRRIDVAGAVTGTAATNGAFNGAVELSGRLASSPDVRQCIARLWLQFAVGRESAPEDACALQRIVQAFSARDYRIDDAVAAVAGSDVLRFAAAP